MKREQLLEVLFDEWSTNHEDSAEYTYACNTGKPDDIIDGVIAESQLAFTAGFNAAVSLLMGGVQ